MSVNNESPHSLRWMRLMIVKRAIFKVGFDVGPELLPFLANVAPLQSRLLVLGLMVIPVIVDGQQFVIILAYSVDLDVGGRNLHDFLDLSFEAFFASALPEHLSSDFDYIYEVNIVTLSKEF